MTETFVARNCIEISRSGKGVYDHEARRNISMSDAEVQALREFFQAERDKNLGLWRFPKNPEITVKRVPERDDTDGRCIVVASESPESSGSTWAFWEYLMEAHGEMRMADVARAYFDAHPEPKPWRESKPGEVWVLTLKGQGKFGAVREYGLNFKLSTGTLMPPKDGRIVAGRRIWPEADNA